MAHNNRIRLAGLWTPGSVIDPAEMEALDAAQYLSLHEGGGTWAITSNMLVGGQPGVGWRFTLPLTVDDLAGHVKNGRKLYIDSGGTLEVNGLVDVKSGGVQKIQPGGLVRVLGAFLNPGAIQIEAGGWLDIQSGGVAFIRASAGLALYGTQTVQSGGVLRVAPSGVIEIAGINGLVIKNGFNGKVEAGGSFDVFGTLACYAGSNVDFQTGFTAAGTASFTGYATISTTATMRILGVATLESDATLTVNGTSGHGAAIYVGTYGQIVFSGGRISGAARVGNQLLFETGLELGGGISAVDASATLQFKSGSLLEQKSGSSAIDNSTKIDGSSTTRTGPTVLSGNNASVAKRVNAGPPNAWSIPGEQSDVIVIPQFSTNTEWDFQAPADPANTVEVTLLQLTPAQGADLTVKWGSIVLCKFLNDAGKRPACASFQWTGSAWRLKSHTDLAGNLGGGTALVLS